MSSLPPMSFPTLNPMDPAVGRSLEAAPSTVDPMSVNMLSGVTDTTMEYNPTAPRAMDPRAGGAMPFPPRVNDPGYMPHMYAPNFAQTPMAPMPYPGVGPIEPFANANGPGTQLASHPYARIESISDLISPASLDFEYSPEMNAVLHVGKCAECVRFGLHILMPGSRAKFLNAVSAHSDSSTEPLRAEIAKLTREALIASKELKELKDALQADQQLVRTLRAERDKALSQHDELSMEHRTISQHARDLEQQLTVALYRRPNSPPRNSRHRSPPRAGTRSNTPYDRVNPQRAGQAARKRPAEQFPVILEPDIGGDVIMASFPANIRPMRMHREQSRYNNRRPCPVSSYRWRTENGVEMVGLPKTRAGTPYLPSDLGMGWYALENDAGSTEEVYRRIDLLFRNRKEELWRAAARGAYEFRRLIEPLPEVMAHVIHLNTLRKSVWTIIDDGINSGADISIVSPGCRLHSEGYGGLYTPDIQIWAVIHAITDVDAGKLSSWTGRTVTTPDLQKMVKDALCSGNYFEITPAELASGKYQLPRPAHYDGALDMDTIVKWLRTTLGLTPYMVHAHFRPFLRRAFETTGGACHRVFSPNDLLPGERLAPGVDDRLVDFPIDRDWTPSRGPRGTFPLILSAVDVNAQLALSDDFDSSSSPQSLSDDTEMLDSGAATANALTGSPTIDRQLA